MDTLNENPLNQERIVNIGIFGPMNAGKCTLLTRLTIDFGNIADPCNFSFEAVKYHVFPIPCSQPDYEENYEISITNCDIVLLLFESHEEKFNKDLMIRIIRDSYQYNITKIIICLNKNDLGTTTDNIKEIKQIVEANEQEIKQIYSKNQIEIAYLNISAKTGTGIDQLLNELHKSTKEMDDKSIQDEEHGVIMYIQDYYEDNEDSKMVVSGKVIQGKIVTNETNLNVSNCSESIKPTKISNCIGQYVDSISKREFITLKFDLGQFKCKIPKNFSKNYLITSPPYNSPKFKVIESIILFITVPCALISPGFKGIFKSGTIIQECTIEKIQKEIVPNQPNTKGKGFIVPELNTLFKTIINLKEDINREKYENNERLGSFTLLNEGK